MEHTSFGKIEEALTAGNLDQAKKGIKEMVSRNMVEEAEGEQFLTMLEVTLGAKNVVDDAHLSELERLRSELQQLAVFDQELQDEEKLADTKAALGSL